MRRTIAISALMAVSLLTVSPCPSQQTSPPAPSAECVWLLSNLDSAKSVAVGQRNLFVSSETAGKLDTIRAQMTSLSTKGVVVYAPVIAAGRITMMRMESQGIGRAPLLQARTSGWDERTFRKALANAQQPGGTFFSRDIHRQLLAENNDIDAGKTVFLFDPEAYGIAPQALELKDTTVLGSTDVAKAIVNLSALQNAHLSPSGFAVVWGLPSSELEFKSIFGGSSQFGDFEEWRGAVQAAKELTSGYGLKPLMTSEPVLPRTKSELLRDMEQQRGIVFVVAHAEGAHIILPGGAQPIDLSPNDIERLHFDKNPFVILRVCQGEDHGFANAFIKAGAIGVWSNRGVIRANVAIGQVRLFLDRLSSTDSLLDALSNVISTDTRAAADSTLFTDVLTKEFNANVTAR